MHNSFLMITSIELKELIGVFYDSKYNHRKTMAHFGVSLEGILKILLIFKIKKVHIQENHLLWSLYFLKCNPSNEVHLFACCWKTWLWVCKRTIEQMEFLLPKVTIFFKYIASLEWLLPFSGHWKCLCCRCYSNANPCPVTWALGVFFLQGQISCLENWSSSLIRFAT